jgi:hypothetical protein
MVLSLPLNREDASGRLLGVRPIENNGRANLVPGSKYAKKLGPEVYPDSYGAVRDTSIVPDIVTIVHLASDAQKRLWFLNEPFGGRSFLPLLRC